MAHAAATLACANAWSRVENTYSPILKAGGATAPLAPSALCCAVSDELRRRDLNILETIKQNAKCDTGDAAAEWQAGFDAGRRGDLYVRPRNVRHGRAWSEGFIEGRARRGRS
jgi:hypothetical protein